MTLGGLLWLIIVVLLALWLLGLLASIGGNLVHLLLVVAVVILLYNLLVGQRAV